MLHRENAARLAAVRSGIRPVAIDTTALRGMPLRVEPIDGDVYMTQAAAENLTQSRQPVLTTMGVAQVHRQIAQSSSISVMT